MARCQGQALYDVSVTKGLFENDPTLVRYRNHAARLFVLSYLELDPPRDVVEGRFQPLNHRRVFNKRSRI
jgi:hypothetical protein